MKKLLYKNSIIGVIQVIYTSVLTFFGIHFFISNLGAELYGIFALVSVIGNLNIFTNLGLNFNLIKFISEQGRVKESDFDVVTALSILTIILLPFTAVLIVFYKVFLLDILRVPVEFLDTSLYLYFFVVIANFFMLIGQVLSAVFDALQKIYITNYLQILYSTMYWGLTIYVVLTGKSLDYIGFVILLATVVWFSITFAYFIRVWGRINLSGIIKNRKRLVKKHLSYGSKLYLSGVLNFFYEPLTKLLISNFLGVSYVGFFDIALKVRTIFWSVIAKILYPLYPYISKLNDTERISKIVDDVQRKMFYFMIIIIFIAVYCSEYFIELWIGQNVEIISLTVISVLVSYLINITGMPNYQYLMTYQVNKTIVFQVTNVIINLVSFLILYRFFGYYSILISFNMAMIITFCLSLYYQNKYLNSFIFRSGSFNLKIFTLSAVLFAVGYFLSYFDNYIMLGIIPAVLTSVSVVIFRYFNFFKKEDIKNYLSDYNRLSLIMEKILVRTH